MTVQCSVRKYWAEEFPLVIWRGNLLTTEPAHPAVLGAAFIEWVAAGTYVPLCQLQSAGDVDSASRGQRRSQGGELCLPHELLL